MSTEKKRVVAIFDIDNTLLPRYSIIDFAEFLAKQGLFDQATWKEIEGAIKEYRDKKITYNQFADIIVALYARGIAGQEVAQIEELSNSFWEARLATLFPYVKEVFTVLKEVGAHTIAISGSTLESLLPLIQHLEFSQVFCTQVGKEEGHFVDRVDLNVASEVKKEEIVEGIAEHLSDEVHSVGFGDSIADAAFLRHVLFAVVVGSRDDELLALAQEKKWIHVPNPLAEDTNLRERLKL